MNFKNLKTLSVICVLLCLTGCWNSVELTDLGFIMGVSIDETNEGKIQLTTQVYAPKETTGGTGGSDKPAYINVKAVDKTIYATTRDLNIYLGRRAQWSHARVILIGEKFAEKHDLGEVLDYFYRDHETRLTMLVLITKGKAADYLEQKPFIERTMSQQLRTMTETAPRFTGKTKRTLLLDIALQLNSKVQTSVIPYIQLTNGQPKTPYVSGAAIISKGKMVDHLTSPNVQKIRMITNDFQTGTIEYPCIKNGTKDTESLDVLSINTKLSPQMTMIPSVHLKTKVTGIIGELRCSSLTTDEEIKKLEAVIEQTIKKDIKVLIERLQRKKVDVIGIGNKIYQRNPTLWKKVEKEWPDIFADIHFDIDVDVNLNNTGMNAGKKVTGE
jgi:spore germination protein KC